MATARTLSYVRGDGPFITRSVMSTIVDITLRVMNGLHAHGIRRLLRRLLAPNLRLEHVL
jgi:hypothetical protein